MIPTFHSVLYKKVSNVLCLDALLLEPPALRSPVPSQAFVVANPDVELRTEQVLSLMADLLAHLKEAPILRGIKGVSEGMAPLEVIDSWVQRLSLVLEQSLAEGSKIDEMGLKAVEQILIAIPSIPFHSPAYTQLAQALRSFLSGMNLAFNLRETNLLHALGARPFSRETYLFLQSVLGPHMSFAYGKATLSPEVLDRLANSIGGYAISASLEAIFEHQRTGTTPYLLMTGFIQEVPEVQPLTRSFFGRSQPAQSKTPGIHRGKRFDGRTPRPTLRRTHRAKSLRNFLPDTMHS